MVIDDLDVDRVDVERFRGTMDEFSCTGLIPASTVAFTAGLTGLELGVVGTIDLGASTALSTSVFLLNGGSGTVYSISLALSLMHDNLLQLDPLCFNVDGGGIIARMLLSDIVISERPTVAGMRLGGRRPEPRIVLAWKCQYRSRP